MSKKLTSVAVLLQKNAFLELDVKSERTMDSHVTTRSSTEICSVNSSSAKIVEWNVESMPRMSGISSYVCYSGCVCPSSRCSQQSSARN